MNNRDIVEATARLDDAIQFRQAAGNRWYPDLLVDRHAIRLTGKEYRPMKTPDSVLTYFSGVAFCQFNAPPLGRNSEAKTLVEAYRERQVSLGLIRAKRPLSAAEEARAAVIAAQLDELKNPTAEVLDTAQKILQGI